ncbi:MULTISPECIES: type VII toxin-antitoxin system HepT family RNase toxin [Shouchella]|uniref:DUF86 domain-containing protein n=2 Tax=Shouchella TaxID=2893057 RepID=A0ABY7W8D6_9BACI|nr:MULTISPECIES: DUF86 domain-containing protein [Shouchella]MED4130308.1 DUF86 domain-containing protein [Shouchella miscanthi]WDF04351.1 DUF86 domain-containing protein [Shouchella hunanensis]GAF24155.1 hypothetical protein JCM19047_4029 [Bacillus sp. JCM 19047]
MYFVDRKRIEQVLTYMEEVTQFLEVEPLQTDKKSGLALERAVAVLIESIIDVGNQLIDGFIMRDPGGYEDIIDILEDENVITVQECDELKKIVQLRKTLAYEYTTIDHQHLYQTITEQLTGVKRFPIAVRAYLKNELGVITAFIPEEQ